MLEGPRSEAFFLPGSSGGGRFALYYSSATSIVRGGILYVHPFAEEMNKSRRMAALQARAFANAGFAVLQIDLYGCGDSSGDFVDARWEIWKSDLALGANWLSERVSGALHLWGLRLGCLLALDAWRDQPSRFSSALLWQPVVNGSVFMTQFLRLAVAGEALRDGAGKTLTTDSLRQRLLSGESVEVAGYELAPQLVLAIDGLNFNNLPTPAATVNWLDVKGESSNEAPLAAQRVITAWREAGVQTQYQAVQGDPFWTTQEIAEAPGLIATSTACLEAFAS